MKKVYEGIYLVTSFLGAGIIAANVNANVLGYAIFLIASITGGYLAYYSNVSRSVLVVNAMFAVINIIGIVRYMA